MTPIELTDPIYHDEEAARLHLEAIRWPEGIDCPLCGGSGHVRPVNGKSMGSGWYYCGDCKGKFTVRVGSIYERSHIPLHKWLLAFRLMASSKKGISAHQLHRTLKITYKSAWFLAHRIREAMKDETPGPMGGNGQPLEVDEAYIGSSGYVFKNEKGWEMKRGIGEKHKIVTLVERGGRAKSIKVDTLDGKSIRALLRSVADPNSILMTDESMIYSAAGKDFAGHKRVNHAKGQYARKGGITTNTVEGYFSIFKRGMKGVYQHCSEQHLQRYLTEFDFRYSNRAALGIDDAERTTLALKGATGKRLTYRRPDNRTAA